MNTPVSLDRCAQCSSPCYLDGHGMPTCTYCGLPAAAAVYLRERERPQSVVVDRIYPDCQNPEYLVKPPASQGWAPATTVVVPNGVQQEQARVELVAAEQIPAAPAAPAAEPEPVAAVPEASAPEPILDTPALSTEGAITASPVSTPQRGKRRF